MGIESLYIVVFPLMIGCIFLVGWVATIAITAAKALLTGNPVIPSIAPLLKEW